MERVADWQMGHMDDLYTSVKDTTPFTHHALDWTNGAMYVGMVKWAAMADSDKYYNWLKDIGDKNDWKLHYRKYFADDHTVGQLYLDLYSKYHDKKMIAPTQEQFDFILYHPAKVSLMWDTPYDQDRWNWCDALFMAPPVWAKLYKATGDKKYLDFLMTEYKATTDLLFDKEEDLFFRDSRFIGKIDQGTKLFWGRGNGWVFAGLTSIMDSLDPNPKEYEYFLTIYKKMAAKLLKLQTPKGHWAMSLLNDAAYPSPETSGSLFNIFGLAWGVNKGILDKKTYEPAIKKGWKAMVSYVTKEGKLGYVQPIGAAPGDSFPDRTEVYGIGAFLSAGSEVYKLYGGK